MPLLPLIITPSITACPPTVLFLKPNTSSLSI
jgi:hypothetical protein